MVSKHPAKGEKVAESMMAVFASEARGAIVVQLSDMMGRGLVAYRYLQKVI